MIRAIRCFCLLLLLTAAVAACTGGEKEKTGGVEATQAYVRHFGSAPTVKEGSCFAVAGYFPLAESPSRVRPVPLFLFSGEGRMEKVVRHLLALDGKVLGDAMTTPFPAGTELKNLTLNGDTVSVELAFRGAPPQDFRGIASSLVHTLAQFPGVRRVRIVAGGAPLPGVDPAGIVPDPAGVVDPDPPRPVGVAAAWEKGAAAAEEVLVLFDRPVSVEKVEILSDGTPLAGDYFQSAFDMAVVIHPARPERVREGMPVKVKWQISDRLGRASSGEEDFPLERQDRP